MTQHEAYVANRVEDLKRVYSALGEAKKPLRETAPHERDYSDATTFNAARAIYNSRMARIVGLQNEITQDAKQLQKGD